MKKTRPPHNFGGLSGAFSDYGNSEIVIMPVPFDKTSTWIRGAERGPDAIISASENMELYDIETGTEVYRKGIHTLRNVTAPDPTGMIRKSYATAKRLLLDDKFVVTLGGEHTVSLGPIRAHIEFYDDISILHLDAHSDMRSSYEGRKYSHACVMARVRELTDATVSVGIRSMDSSELSGIDSKRVFYASGIRGKKGWAGRVLSMLSRNVYVTIDLDVLDPSVMPSTGTPEPGGLDWYQLVGLLEMVAKKRRVVGFDVVELCPSESRAPDFLAAKLTYKFLSLIFS
jgi:agmatinase